MRRDVSLEGSRLVGLCVRIARRIGARLAVDIALVPRATILAPSIAIQRKIKIKTKREGGEDERERHEIEET